MDIIVYGFKYTNFTIINIESIELMANVLKEYIFLSLCDEELCESAK